MAKKARKAAKPRNPLNQDLNLHNKHATDQKLAALTRRVHKLANFMTTKGDANLQIVQTELIARVKALEQDVATLTSRVNGLNLSPQVAD